MASKMTLFVVLLMVCQALSAQENISSDMIALNSYQNSAIKWNLYSLGTSQLKFNLGRHLQSLDTFGAKVLNNNIIQRDVQNFRWFKAAIVPASLVVLGSITLLPAKHCLLSKYTIRTRVLEASDGWTTRIDNNLQFAPIAAVFVLKAFGVKSRSDILNQAIITAKTELLTNLIVHGMKNVIPSERPNGGAHSMPSGHTAQAFLSATILDMEYRDTSPWISVSGYAVASATGMFRMVNNKHWISDVLIGAGIGIFSTKVVYFTHKYRWGKKSKIVILPAIYPNGGGGVSFAMML
jgi:membrane-associated phospholipid phosphatase